MHQENFFLRTPIIVGSMTCICGKDPMALSEFLFLAVQLFELNTDGEIEGSNDLPSESYAYMCVKLCGSR